MNQTQSITAPRSKTYEITMTALMAAVTCILAPLSIPIGPVPISFTNLAIYLSLYLLGWKKGTISYLIYLLLGLVGLPVFSGFTGGPSKLAGPTGGYIIGFIVMAVIAGLVIDNCRKPWIQLIGMIVGTIVCYLFGTIWFCLVANYTFKAALAVCVIPFIPADLVKMIIAMIIGPMIKKRIRSSRQSPRSCASMDFDSAARINKNAPDQSSGAFLLHCISIISSVDQF